MTNKKNDKATTECLLMNTKCLLRSPSYCTHLFRSPVNFLFDALPPKNIPKKLVFISYQGLSWLPSALLLWCWGQKFDTTLTIQSFIKRKKISHTIEFAWWPNKQNDNNSKFKRVTFVSRKSSRKDNRWKSEEKIVKVRTEHLEVNLINNSEFW